MLVQIQEQKQKVKISQILKNATEAQCFGYFMKISEITNLGEDHHYHQITSSTSSSTATKNVLKLCVNGLLMSKAGIGDGSSTLSIYDYVAMKLIF
jgi:hypothetical protein